jgi:membrane protein involved in colicin uptake
MKAYLLVPLAALLAFLGWRSHAVGELRAAETARQTALAAEHQAKLQAERDAQAAAMAAALAEQAQRKQERAAREAADLADQKARQAALDRLDTTRRRQADLTRQLDRLRLDLAAAQKSLADLESRRALAAAEQEFLAQLSAQSAANLRDLTALLDRLPHQ